MKLTISAGKREDDDRTSFDPGDGLLQSIDRRIKEILYDILFFIRVFV